jgi:hypothetical protein
VKDATSYRNFMQGIKLHFFASDALQPVAAYDAVVVKLTVDLVTN